MDNFTELSNVTRTATTILQRPHAEFDTGETTWLLSCTAFTWLMVPGVGFFYNGMAPTKSSLVLLMTCLWTVAVVSIQWFIIGYTLCLSETGSSVIGNVDHLFFWGVDKAPSGANPEIPAMLVGVWYCLFSVITPTIIIGAVAERARFLPMIIFIFIWSTVVFDFLTYWTWNPNGWLFKHGSLDFGGGTPVHISTGFAALAFAAVLGKRDDRSEKPPHNIVHVVLGTCFIWAGWMVANAGSGLKPNHRAVVVFITTNMAASMGGITWGVVDYVRTGKFSALGYCTGVVSGLVAVTPASGFVAPASSLVFGAVGALSCYFALKCKHLLPVDDAFDVFCIHGVGGIMGNLLTGIFAQKSVAASDGTHIDGGWLDGNWAQVGIQAIDTLAGGGWSFVWTYVILWVLDKVPGLSLRVPPEVEKTTGIDEHELGEKMYQYRLDEEWKNSTVNVANSANSANPSA